MAAAVARALRGMLTGDYEVQIGGNHVGAEGCRQVAAVLAQNSTLKSLNLTMNSIELDGCNALAEALMVNSTLTELNLQRNGIGDFGGCGPLAGMLTVNSTLVSLDLSQNYIGAAGCRSLAMALQVNASLQELILDGNDINDACCVMLATVLAANTTLKSLRLRDCFFGEAGARALAEALVVNTTLTRLDVIHVPVGETGFSSIAEALMVNSTLHRLDIAWGTKVALQLDKADMDRVEQGLVASGWLSDSHVLYHAMTLPIVCREGAHERVARLAHALARRLAVQPPLASLRLAFRTTEPQQVWASGLLPLLETVAHTGAARTLGLDLPVCLVPLSGVGLALLSSQERATVTLDHFMRNLLRTRRL